MNVDLNSYIWIAITILIGASISIISIIKDIKKEKKISKLTILIISLIFLYTIAEFFKSKIEKQNQEKDKVEVIDAINKTHDLIGIKEFPGFTITTLVSIEELNDKRRKYIFDIGVDPNTNRISLYLDNGNNLVYCIIDNDGVPHTIKIPQKIHTFEFNTLYFLHCEYGDAEEYNFMRFSINDTHFEPLKFKNKLDIPKNLQQSNTTMFTDIEKKKYSLMTISQFLVAHVAFTDDQKDKLMNTSDWYMKEIKKANN